MMNVGCGNSDVQRGMHIRDAAGRRPTDGSCARSSCNGKRAIDAEVLDRGIADETEEAELACACSLEAGNLVSLSVEGAREGCAVDADGSLPRIAECDVGSQHAISCTVRIDVVGKGQQVGFCSNLEVLGFFLVAAQRLYLFVGHRRFPESDACYVCVVLLTILVTE